MKERPILFSAPMVRALLDDTKTQTRRIANIPLGWAPESPPVLGRITSPHPKKGRFGVFARRGLGTDFPEADLIPCRYGQPGDRIWVREAWRTVAGADDIAPRDLMNVESLTHYEADGNPVGMGKLRPSMFMPRWASRINLEIVNVRVERLQDISEADAMAEGVCASGWSPSYSNPDNAGCDESISAVENYAELWEQINGAGSWDANPFVWCISFKRLEAA